MGKSARDAFDDAELYDVVRQLPDVLFSCYKAEDGKIYFSLNEGGLAEQFGLTTAQIVGKSLGELFPGGASSHVVAEFEAAFNGETREWVNEIEGRFFKHFPQPIMDKDGNVTHVIGFISEVTELVNVERKLATANEDLRIFANGLGHDLQSPLSAALLMLETLERHPEKASEIIPKLRRPVKRMQAMVNNLLELARAGRAELSVTTIDLSEMAEQIVDELRTVNPSDVDVTVEAGTCEADPKLCRAVVANLVGNAWKYAKSKLAITTTTRDHRQWLVVQDDGPGFDDGQDLFAAFAQGKQAHPGFGLGLSIVARAVARHGGSIVADGKQGGRFEVTFEPAAA